MKQHRFHYNGRDLVMRAHTVLAAQVLAAEWIAAQVMK